MIRTSPYQNLFWDMIVAAQVAKASDIHIQPEANGVLIRFRIFGEMNEWKTVPETHRSPFLQEAKRLSQCSVAVSGKAQDSRIALAEQSLDIRVSLIPSLYGEKLVLRLLDRNRSFSLEQMELSFSATKAIRKALENKTGVNLLTGPTGSGKTTVLYSSLAELNRSSLNIVTIEDPIEYTFPGITQVQVTPRLGLNEALRAILRQDPDVILLGEVRDAETAKLCFQAASTGHLVLSTLHANSASEAKSRLETLGVSPDLIASCLRFSSAQRLLPKLCPLCRILDSTHTLSENSKSPYYQKNSKGCADCYRGAVGRVPIMEFIEWKSGVSNPSDSPSPFKNLKEIALESAEKGEVDLYDALKIG